MIILLLIRIDVFSLYLRKMFCFFKCRLIHVHPRACVCIINERQKANSLENITWSELGKQIIHSSRDSVRKARESHLIDKAMTLEPHGLNRRDELL